MYSFLSNQFRSQRISDVWLYELRAIRKKRNEDGSRKKGDTSYIFKPVHIRHTYCITFGPCHRDNVAVTMNA